MWFKQGYEAVEVEGKCCPECELTQCVVENQNGKFDLYSVCLLQCLFVSSHYVLIIYIIWRYFTIKYFWKEIAKVYTYTVFSEAFFVNE